jgi:hypothetical protein
MYFIVKKMEEVAENQGVSQLGNVWKIIVITILITLVVIILVGVYLYFTIISPSFVSKPILEKPPLENSIQEPIPELITRNYSDTKNNSLPVIGAKHIIFLLNEMDVYKLHNAPSGDIPRIDFIITDTNQEYFFSVDNNNIIEIDRISNPDVRISSDAETIVYVYGLDNSRQATMNKYNSGKISVEVLADVTTLALKGYKSVAHSFGITGFSIFKFI